MISLVAVSQKVQDLLLAVLNKECPIPLRTLLSETVHIAGWQFEFTIIGESHSVAVRHEGQLVLREILACMKLDAADCKVYQSFADMQAFSYEDKPYQVSVGFAETLPIWEAATGILRYEFPLTHGQIPETRLQWQLEAGQIRWHSLHSYPEAQGMTVVLSESLFRFA